MTTLHKRSAEEVLAAAIRVPPHVVLRPFDEETVVLNLDTGKYHSLNPVGGRFLHVLGEAPSVRDALIRLQREFPNQDPTVVQADVLQFCESLASAGVVEVVERR
jgi:hypothetical protein